MIRSMHPRTPPWLLACCLLLSAAGLRAQETPSPPSDAEAVAAELAAAREASLRAAAVFLDGARGLEERLAAADGFGTFLDEAHEEAAVRLVRDASAAAPLRAAALRKLSTDVLERDELIDELLGLLTSPGTPPELQEAALDVAESLAFSSLTAHARRGDFLEAYRQLIESPVPRLRHRALARLSAEADDLAQQRLIDGLRSPDRALVPPADAVRLLGLRMPADAFPVLQELLARPPDEETRIEAIHHLGAHPPSRDALIAVLQDEEESPEAREAALGALHANVPQSLPEIVTPVLRDEGATDRLKVRAMKAVQWHRLSSAQEARMEGLEEFDAAVRAMAERSRSEEVRDCAREYLGTVESAEPPGA